MTDDEDFLIDDVLAPRRKKKVDGKRKGNRGELELTKILTERFGTSFSRSVGSGNRLSQVNLPQHAKDVYSGDIVVPKNFAWTVEVKNGYSDVDLGAIFGDGCRELDAFLQQAADDAGRCGRKPLLCWKRDRKPWLAFVRSCDLIGDFDYRLVYREWSGVDLKKLLMLEDEFFLSP